MNKVTIDRSAVKAGISGSLNPLFLLVIRF